ncbi:MAG TPA: lipid-A-disaccharide synthase N-terminal domain-containing protein [Candidatus Saccharimonadales bacterium]|nr:lipid-A-disaccharide synthase N-terminal domain-containing protein [Candidatus Saccharimonadales bacterium]
MTISMTHLTLWLILGFTGQALFFSRFLVQWIHSERLGRSEVPAVFWYLSLGGGLLLLVYAVWIKDPVFILGQSAGAFVYVRNLMLLRRAGPGGGPLEER